MELVQVTFDDVKAQAEAEKNFIANIIAANEIQIDWMKHSPSFDMETFPLGFDIEGWLAEVEAKTPEGQALPGSEEFELFARALTLTAITTRLTIPEKYVLLDHYVSAAARALVVTHEAVEKAKAELVATKVAQQGQGFNVMTSPIVDDTTQLIRECHEATMAKLNAMPATVDIPVSAQVE
jgi:hypothetical protein